jgi:hypothetical protein
MPFSEQALKKYKTKFGKLRRADTPYGKAPHQPVFLLTIIEEIEKNAILTNHIRITPEIVALFKENRILLCSAMRGTMPISFCLSIISTTVFGTSNPTKGINSMRRFEVLKV